MGKIFIGELKMYRIKLFFITVCKNILIFRQFLPHLCGTEKNIRLLNRCNRLLL